MALSGVDYFTKLSQTAPFDLQSQLNALPDETIYLVDAFLRLVLGGPCPSHATDNTRSAWEPAQKTAAELVATLNSTSPGKTNGIDSRKRARDDDDTATSSTSSQPKRAKTSEESELPSDDPPLFTLHALSLTSPIRKKADITIHQRTLRLTNPTTHAIEYSPMPLSAFRRAFLLPTRGKTKPHWSVVLMPSDIPAAGSKVEREKEPAPPVVFGLDAMPAGLSTTAHHAAPAPQTTAHPKGTSALPLLRSFLSFLPIPTLEPSTDVFRSALPGGSAAGAGEGIAGVEAYRGAKPGTLWFLSEGVLWDGKPAEFFALKDIAKTEGEGESKVEGVRTISATGKTCSVILRRVEGTKAVEGEGEDEDEEARVVEVDFGMIDGKEQESIARWVKRHKHLFGRQSIPESQTDENGGATAATASAAPAVDEDDEDENDSDFVADSGSDYGSATSDSESEDESGDVEGAQEGGDEAEVEAEAEESEDEEAELDPKHHPLLRPGAMPRMSRAAIEAAVDIVQSGLAGGSTVAREALVADDDEEDELDE